MIRKLPNSLIDQIAAGEVIERPSAALKELLENALDADASEISVGYLEGGLKNLSVEDDGLGLEESDAELLFEAHATSKLNRFEDFQNLKSFGFRGEALAALSSVSELIFESSHRRAPTGLRLQKSFGGPLQMQSINKRSGTRVEVRDLFFRLPARLKFLKSARAEAQSIVQVFRRYALGFPEKKWTLKSEDSMRKELLAPASFLERVLWFFESDEPDEWAQIEKSERNWNLKIFYLLPRYRGRAKTGFQFYLNRRPFKDAKLEAALRRAFEGFTEFPREMSVAVFLEGPPSDFDVNVHPTKNEVRFVDSDFVFQLIYRALRESLNQLHRKDLISISPGNSDRPRVESEGPSMEVSTGEQNILTAASPPLHFGMPQIQHALFEVSSQFEYWGHLDNTYLVAKRGEDLFLFDQHALHERILYEEVLEEWNRKSSLTSQRLLFPWPTQISKEEVGETTEEHWQRFGFDLREWKADKLQIVAAPQGLKRDLDLVLKKILQNKNADLESIVRNVIATIACHRAIRAHDVISNQEIANLFKRFSSEDALGHCPHGRPTFIRFQKRELEKLFHRVL